MYSYFPNGIIKHKLSSLNNIAKSINILVAGQQFTTQY